jgi:hypothetical protein
MKASRHLQNWIAIRAWQMFSRWSKIDLDPGSLTARERWAVVPTVFQRQIHRGRLVAVGRTPSWIVACPASAGPWVVSHPDPWRG